MSYESFVENKLTRQQPTGFAIVPPLHPALFEFQRDLVSWALRRGRAALFAATGLGKTMMQVEWSRHVAADTKGDVLIVAPLSVTTQTSREASRLGVDVHVCREDGDARPGINITNYDRLHRFDPSRFAGVVLDESSCIKHHAAATLAQLLAMFATTRFKLCATATPAPNDYVELGTHAEFLGVCKRTEMLSEFFVHDGSSTQDWRIKGHARAAFWRWVASWAALVRTPSDIGYPDDGYVLPLLTVTQHDVAADAETVRASGRLFAEPAATLSDQRAARRATLGARVQRCVDLVQADREQWVVWCELNAEQDAVAKALGDYCVSIFGALDAEEKELRYARWAAGDARILVSKVSIFGFGINMQHAARMAFVGVSHSWEAWHQSVRRCWRFGQKRPVAVHVFASELEGAIVANLERKERDAEQMASSLSEETRAVVRSEVSGSRGSTDGYGPSVSMAIPAWLTSEEGAA